MERVDGGAGMGARGSAAAMLGMEMHHLAHQPQPQIHASSAFQQPPEHLHHGNGGGGGFQVQHHQPMPVRQQHPPPSYAAYVAPPSRAVKAHEEEEMGNGVGNGGGVVQQPGAGSPWTRMKWTDAMVRLLIAVVYNAGDDGEGVSAGGKAAASHGKASASAAAHGGHGPQAAAQQKKGKWKSVSRAMMEHSFMVSPQQCEDKFNDLNKRYKRVVDLLGRGTACKVVENPALLDAMDELTPKAKEEARKLLSSKHLFFREMCTYHNPGGTAAAASHGADCFHHPRPATVPGAANSSAGRQVVAMVNSSTRSEDDSEDDVLSSKEAEEEEEDDAEEEEEEEEDDDLDDVEEKAPGTKRRGGRVDDSSGFHNYGWHSKRRRGESSATRAGEDGEEDGNKKPARRRPSAIQRLQRELAAAAAGGDQQQLRQWMRRRAMELEEEQLAYECREYELEKQRHKWEQFRAKKEWDMEHERLRAERLRVDGRRMLLMLQQKEFDLDVAEANYSSSVDHQPGGAQTPPPSISSPAPAPPPQGTPTRQQAGHRTPCRTPCIHTFCFS